MPKTSKEAVKPDGQSKPFTMMDMVTPEAKDLKDVREHMKVPPKTMPPAEGGVRG